MKKNENASGSGQGYLYQFLLGLNLALEKSRTDEDVEINIENFDDISFLSSGEPIELIQAKHRSTPKNLSNGSPDLWKTLAIWIKRDEEQTALSGKKLIFYLVTNASSSSNSAAEKLTSSLLSRNVEDALNLLLSIAESSDNVATSDYRQLFLKTPDKQRRDLLGRVFIADNSPGIEDLSKELANEFLVTVMPKHKSLVVERLVAWWMEKVIELLVDSSKSLPVKIITQKLQSICYEYHNENLPIEFLDHEPTASDDWDKRVFVQQVRFISNRNERIKNAIRDYYRACEQRLKWAREELLIDDEMDKYEKKLIEEWNRFKDARLDEMDVDSEENKRKCGVSIYNWIETQANFPIRKFVEEPYVMRGSFHILSEDKKVGWHPDFLTKLKQIFGD